MAELENATEAIQEISLRNSSRTSTLDPDRDTTSDITQSETSRKTDEEILGNSGTTRNGIAKTVEDCDSSSQRLSVPSLELSKSSITNPEDVFSTPAADFVLEKKKYFTRLFNENRDFAQPTKSNKAFSKTFIAKSETNLKAKSSEHKFDEKKVSSGQSGSDKSEEAGSEKVSIDNLDERIDEKKWKNKTSASASRVNRQRSRIPRTASSVPWIRAKHGSSFRKKLRGFELRSGRCAETVPTFAALR